MTLTEIRYNKQPVSKGPTLLTDLTITNQFVGLKAMTDSIIRKKMHFNTVDITGQVFGRLTVLGYAGIMKGAPHWDCKCSCGRVKVARGSLLRNGDTRSCGCISAENRQNYELIDGKHASKHPLFSTWKDMIRRCYNVKHKRYYRYGKRGISVSIRWRNSFHAFVKDMGPKPTPKHTIDRKFNDGDYAAANCRWATDEVQGQNKGCNILTPDLVREIRSMYANGVIQADIARYYSLRKGTVCEVVHRKTWKNVD